jgi:hypothetical protein
VSDESFRRKHFDGEPVCIHCGQAIRKLRLGASHYAALPEDTATCTMQSEADGYCPQGSTPVPEALHWLVSGVAVPNRRIPPGLTKTDAIIAHVRTLDQPFTIEGLERTFNPISRTTIYRALDQLPLYFASQPQGNHFWRLYFPLEWSADQCREHLNKGVKSGKSTAKLRGG